MFQRVLPIVLMASLVAPIAAQTPAGWKVHIDESQNAQDPDDKSGVMFMAMGKGFHVSGGPAGTYWNPSYAATGNYILKGTFTLVKPSNHTNYYGLVFGGNALEGGSQTYTYFVVAQNGRFLIKQRRGQDTTDVQPATANAAIKTPDGTGRSVNVLEVRVAGDTISYVVNGTVVHTTPKSVAKTDGVAGFRVNHVLEVMLEGFGIQKG